jgi:flavin reductase (DIM6/NTAB) family NADH-FMN oxidoreductase RutF
MKQPVSDLSTAYRYLYPRLTVIVEEPQKIEKTGFTLEASTEVKTPRIKECQINLECKLDKIVSTGDHDLFIGKVVFIAINREIMDDWAFNLRKFQPIYWKQSKSIEDTYELALK